MARIGERGKVLSAGSIGHRHPEAARRSRSIAPQREAAQEVARNMVQEAGHSIHI